jgi:GMP synthase (glutamine-hydrolysing)
MFDRIPFPGPALAARIIGEVIQEGLDTVRKVTTIVEELLGDTDAFQYMAILHEDRVTGITQGKREFGQQIEVRCWDSVDARTATTTKLSFDILNELARQIISQVPGIVSVTYNIAPKPPSTIEAV